MFVPSAFITVICPSEREKAICFPSGDQSGDFPSASNFWFEPSAAITATHDFPFLIEAKAISVPSGDQSGRPLSPSKVSCFRLPLGAMTKICSLHVWSRRVKAIKPFAAFFAGMEEPTVSGDLARGCQE